MNDLLDLARDLFLYGLAATGAVAIAAITAGALVRRRKNLSLREALGRWLLHLPTQATTTPTLSDLAGEPSVAGRQSPSPARPDSGDGSGRGELSWTPMAPSALPHRPPIPTRPQAGEEPSIMQPIPLDTASAGEGPRKLPLDEERWTDPGHRDTGSSGAREDLQ